MLDHQSPSDRPWTRPRGRYATSINSRFSKPWALNRVGLDLARKNRSCLACNDQLFDDVVIIRGHTASSSTVSDKCENIKICSTMPYATTAHYSQLSQTLKKKKKTLLCIVAVGITAMWPSISYPSILERLDREVNLCPCIQPAALHTQHR